MPNKNLKTLRSRRGFSLVELLIVVAVGGILTSIAIPAMMSQRRLLRTTSTMREIVVQLRYARQMSISTRQSVTFQYDDDITKKLITIINHHNNEPISPGDPAPPYPASCQKTRTAILGTAGFPMTACSTVVTTYPLTQGGLAAAEISYGIPSGAQLPVGAPVIPVTKLDDTIVMTALASGKVNITFQADGSVIDPTTGIPLDRALYFYNNKAAQGTASAVSVVGASGRAKVWRYTTSGNQFIE